MPFPAYERGVTRHPLDAAPAGLRLTERSISVPVHARQAVAALVSSWEFKRRAGFEVPAEDPDADADGVLAKRLFGVRFAEPVRVVWAGREGFGYETRPGHPLYGEESFVLDGDLFTARSLSCPSNLFWHLASPALRALQLSVSRRYIRIVESEIAAASR
ncbi:DUF1990 domain-containing protein [Microbacterium sp. SSW1-49]|uniref:DUF1990 domain-containing protein n=1 Tax=Microbacterium croceum TaxID=2851645 RepID=A0ABT0FH44_9MICO|nr:DUF1990 family protein [Microbacterium croceum]MCK2037037.1 DUF1990 domain-containing protein [Microbacterium croceum]